MSLLRDNNPIQLSRMRLEKGKRLEFIAPLMERNEKNIHTGQIRSQNKGSRQRATGYASGIRGANTRLENTGKESKLVDVSNREFRVRRRRPPPVNLMRTPIKQGFATGERPSLNVDRTSHELPPNY